MQTKYVIFNNGIMDKAIVFGETLSHAEIADMITRKFPGVNIVSAGFVGTTKDNKKIGYGESISLLLKSRGEQDTRALNEVFCIDNEY